MQVVTAKPTSQKTSSLKQHRKPFEMPVKDENEKTFDYVMGIKPDSEVETLTIAGMSFAKRVLPNCASFLAEQERYHEPRLIARPFTEKQAKAILERAAEIEVEIPARQNMNYRGDSGESEYLPAKFIKASDIIILCKVNEYNPLLFQTAAPRETVEGPKEGNIKDDMYKAQAKMRGKS